MLKQNLIELKLSQKRVKEESQLLFPLIPKTNAKDGEERNGDEGKKRGSENGIRIRTGRRVVGKSTDETDLMTRRVKKAPGVEAMIDLLKGIGDTKANRVVEVDRHLLDLKLRKGMTNGSRNLRSHLLQLQNTRAPLHTWIR